MSTSSHDQEKPATPSAEAFTSPTANDGAKTKAETKPSPIYNYSAEQLQSLFWDIKHKEFILQGFDLAKASRHAEAVEKFSKWLRLTQPKRTVSALVLTLQGDCLLKLNLPKDALKSYQQGLEVKNRQA